MLGIIDAAEDGPLRDCRQGSPQPTSIHRTTIVHKHQRPSYPFMSQITETRFDLIVLNQIEATLRSKSPHTSPRPLNHCIQLTGGISNHCF